MRLAGPHWGLRRVLLGGAVALVLFAVQAPSALAHAALLESVPSPGARVEASPSAVTLSFTEPLNRKLTTVVLSDAATGRVLRARVEAGGRGITVRAAAPLERGAYRVKWHTVSTEDGHALEGSFGFGVRTAAVGGRQALEQSPFARGGWLRILTRGLFYMAFVLFAGGLLTSALLSPRKPVMDWLLPAPVSAAPAGSGRLSDDLGEGLRRRVVDAGWLAAGSAVAVALVEAADAGSGLSATGLSDYIASNVAGLGRAATVIAIVLALALLSRSVVLAAAWAAIGLMAIAFSGHANSADPRLLAVLTDWIHLLAGAVWVGGLAHVVLAWLPSLRGGAREVRRLVISTVLARFGRVALPAFLLVAGTGLLNALTQLGDLTALWQTGYGVVLSAKIALVGAIALASYWHALRLRPLLLASNPHPDEGAERRHRWLLGGQPAAAAAVLLAAAVLVTFPLPPRQLAGSQAEARAPACDPCPQRKPRADELGAAERAGSSIAAAWLRGEGDGLRGEVRVLDLNAKPRDTEPRVRGASGVRSCGPGCLTFRLRSRPKTVDVDVGEKGRVYTARIPARWVERDSARARALLERAQLTMRRLRSVRELERITSGPGSLAVTRYRLSAPDRLSYESDDGRSGSVVIGKDQWLRVDGGLWEKTDFGGGLPFRTRRWFRWTNYARSVRMLTTRTVAGRRVADIALMDHGTPVWIRLTIDLATHRVVYARMVTGGHFMRQRLFAFNRPAQIAPPPTGTAP